MDLRFCVDEKAEGFSSIRKSLEQIVIEMKKWGKYKKLKFKFKVRAGDFLFHLF